LVLGVCGLAGAADDKVVDPVGTWKCEYEIGGQQRTSNLKITKDGDNLAGTMSWPDQHAISALQRELLKDHRKPLGWWLGNGRRSESIGRRVRDAG
jgi:hypothetical protein